jgi:F0F1-type ATP synthase membrane subunit b/b'
MNPEAGFVYLVLGIITALILVFIRFVLKKPITRAIEERAQTAVLALVLAAAIVITLVYS